MAVRSTLFVANLGPISTPEELEEVFGKFSGFISSRIRKDKIGMNVGFVDFTSESAAEFAMQEINAGGDDTRKLVVSYAKKPSDSRKRSREDFDQPGRDRPRPPFNERPPYMEERHQFREPASHMDERFGDYGHRDSRPPAGADFYGGPPPYGGDPHYSEPPPNFLPPNATPTLFIEGTPPDATEREMSHIFRPFQGYQSVRLAANRKSKSDRDKWLCFVEFTDVDAAFAASNALQGYKMDYDDLIGLRITFAREKERRRRPRDGPGSSYPHPFEDRGSRR